MMRSMFSGVTGLRNHQVRMDVIGNNIANVNTVGFKKSRVNFKDAMNQTMRGASSPQGNRAGTNPMQVGLGMTIASIDTLHTPSSLESTGYMTDMAIEGDGYFILRGANMDQFYTRAGTFDFDRNGNLYHTGTGLMVLGWQDKQNHVVPSDRTTQNLTNIEIRKGMMIEARATENAVFAKNLDAETEVSKSYTVPFSVYDSLGVEHKLSITFTKTNDNTWEYRIDKDPSDPADGTIQFDSSGKINTATGNLNNWPQITINPGNGAENIVVSMDFSQLTQYAAETNVDLASQDGYAAGTLLGVTVDDQGVISGVFDNGLNQQLAQIALANFDNPGGLIKAGQNLYRFSNNSGQPQIGQAGTGGRGTVAPGSLEMSNVDLSEEFTQMIITQRGFQANSRIITTSDEMLQELVNLKR